MISILRECPLSNHQTKMLSIRLKLCKVPMEHYFNNNQVKFRAEFVIKWFELQVKTHILVSLLVSRQVSLFCLKYVVA